LFNDDIESHCNNMYEQVQAHLITSVY